VVSTTEQHKKDGKCVNERGTQPPNVSQKSGTSKQSTQHIDEEKKKTPVDNFDDEGDHNPLRGSLEKPHKIPITSKINGKKNQEGINEVKHEDKITLEDMNLDANIKDIKFPNEEKRVQESR
jgi:hypothetical protein